MRRPVIGITTYSRSEANDFSLPAAYVDVIQAAGATAVLLPPQENPEPLIEILDGLIFAGGGDIDPARYGSDRHHETIYLVDPERDEFELKLAELILKSQLPTLGICRGMQVLTVASGGDLIVHVPDAYGDRVTHRLDHPRRPTPHSVQADSSSRLASLLEAIEFEIVSWHHQAVKTVPPNWKPAARAADGLVEAIEHQQHPWLIAVQWHPELSPDDLIQQRLFRSFVDACRSS